MNKYLFATSVCAGMAVSLTYRGKPLLAGCYVIAAAIALIASAIAETGKGGK